MSTPPSTASGASADRKAVLEGQILDVDQHDHEQEQDHDAAGVDQDLHRRQELGVAQHEEHRHHEEGLEQGEGGVDRASSASITPTAPATASAATT
jgi:hypothetical protein